MSRADLIITFTPYVCYAIIAPLYLLRKGKIMGKLNELIQAKIDQAEANADSEWRIRAEEYTAYLATKRKLFTSDDILIWLDDHGYHTGTKSSSALGAVMRRLKADGAIEPVGWRTSIRASRHKAPVRVWRSLIYEEDV